MGLAIANRRLVAMDEAGVTFHYKDYRRDGAARQRTMVLAPGEFIRRFQLHVLPRGFHRIRHYGLLASAGRRANLARAGELLAAPMPTTPPPTEADEPAPSPHPRPPCPCCGGRMVVIAVFTGAGQPRAPPTSSAFVRECTT